MNEGGGAHSRGCCSELRALKHDILGQPRSRDYTEPELSVASCGTRPTWESDSRRQQFVAVPAQGNSGYYSE
jgi:hypothetical protein